MEGSTLPGLFISLLVGYGIGITLALLVWAGGGRRYQSTPVMIAESERTSAAGSCLGLLVILVIAGVLLLSVLLTLAR